MSEVPKDPKGVEMFEKVLGRPEPKDKPLEGVRELAVNHLFAKIWSRPGLRLRDRRLITIALLAAQGRADQLREHVRGARLGADGLSREEIVEAMVHVAHYAGWAAGASGQAVALSVLDELEP
ncbi:MAG TPA: carboxymuconolactone decarboxylase family protein [Vicinamibacteria bacterium]|nr:carboxymuconolactone decarboxylase family protein [Vicinamibacteria bacterium]